MTYFMDKSRSPAENSGYLFLPGSMHVEASTKVPVRRIHVDITPLFACSSERYAPLFLPIEKIQRFAK